MNRLQLAQRITKPVAILSFYLLMSVENISPAKAIQWHTLNYAENSPYIALAFEDDYIVSFEQASQLIGVVYR